jgi:hypothetical protein
MADERAKGAHRKLFVLRNGKVDAKARFRHYEMASDLTNFLPLGLLESYRRFFAGNVGEARHFARQKQGFQGVCGSRRWS